MFETDLSFRRLYTASAALRSVAMLGAQVNRLDELSESGGLPDDQLAMYIQFYGIMVSLVNDASDDLRALNARQ